MRKPSPEKPIKDITLTKSQCDQLKVDEVFNDLPTNQWVNVAKLISKSIKCYNDTLEGKQVFGNIISSLELIHQKTKDDTMLSSYSLKCSRYLKQDHVKSLFIKTFAKKIIQFQAEELKSLNREKGYRNATLITSQLNDVYYEELVSGSRALETLEDSEEEETGLPSDLTFDHHPERTAHYFLLHDDSSDEVVSQDDENDWIIKNHNISEKIKSIKENTLALRKNPSNLSDIRLLCLNDVYFFDENMHESITKYLGEDMHQAIMSNINFSSYRPPKPEKSHLWCMKIAENPPNDLISTTKLCADFLTEASKQENEVDLYMAHTLTHLLPVLVSGSDDDSLEDSYIHHYLAPILQPIFSTNKKFTVQWANGFLNESSLYKPDFQVFSYIINIKCTMIIAEFKPKSRSSSIESDFVKLGKQMKVAFNHLVEKRLHQPTVCGLLSQGKSLNIYVMDMPSPQIYRMIKLSKSTLCRNIEEMHLLPSLIYKLVQVKNITLEKMSKAESHILSANMSMQLPPYNPPKAWLSHSSFHLTRSNKKRKSDE